MELRGLQWLSIDLTHRCNLNCDWCGKRTHESDYEMTLGQIDAMLAHINLGATHIRVSGGEPLVHPQFEAAMSRLLTKFQTITVATNGTLLHTLPLALTGNPRIHYFVSYYGTKPVTYTAHTSDVTPVRFYDPYRDPSLGDEDAVSTYLRCGYVQIKVIGDKVYDCCHAETIERVYGGDYHSLVGPTWRRDLESIDRWPACKHCFVARPRLYEPPHQAGT